MAANPEDTIDPTTHSPRLSTLFSYPKHFFTSVLPQQWQNVKDFEYQQKLSELLSNTKFKNGALITLGIVGVLTLPFTLPLLLSAASLVLSSVITTVVFIMQCITPYVLFNLLNNYVGIISQIHKLMCNLNGFIDDKLPDGAIKNTLRTIVSPACNYEILRAFMYTGSICMGVTWALFSQASLGLLIASFFVAPACLAFLGLLRIELASGLATDDKHAFQGHGHTVGATPEFG